MPQFGDARRILDAAENASPVDAVESVTRQLHADLNATRITFLIADLAGRALVRLTHGASATAHEDTDGAEDTAGAEDGDRGRRRDARESATVLPFDGGDQEQAVRTQQVVVRAPDDSGDAGGRVWTVLAPVTERGESLGLLELLLDHEPDDADVDAIRHAAHLLAFVVIANRRHTDLFEWGQRTRPFTLSAEIQRRLLPDAFTCEAASFTLSAWLEPAASVGGDTFDYSLARDVLHLSMTDAMGHGVSSALSATLAVSALRSARRVGTPLVDQVAAANTALVAHSSDVGSESFVTGLFGRIDLLTGTLSVINAGHVAPFLVRDGRVGALELPAGLPLGLFPDATYPSTDLTLHPGDRLVLVTDGMMERNAAGFALPDGIGDTLDLHPREAVRSLADRVLEATGQDLEDDATLLILDWYDGHVDERTTVAGSGVSRTSDRAV